MKLSQLRSILYSNRYDATPCIIQSVFDDSREESYCFVENAIKDYGNKEVRRITAQNNILIILLA